MFHLRLPDHIKDALKAAADTNRRTMTAEVIAALEVSLTHERKPLAYEKDARNAHGEIREDPATIPASTAGLTKRLQRLDSHGRALVIALLDQLDALRDLQLQVAMLIKAKPGNR